MSRPRIVSSGIKPLPQRLKLPEAYPAAENHSARSAQLRSEFEARNKLEPAETHLLSELRWLGASEVDLFHGTHVVLRGDQGAFYQRWLPQGRQRISSHYSEVKVPQFEVRLSKGAVLMGRTAQGDSWFQVERSSLGLRAPHRSLLHLWDYVLYRLSGHNIGPAGRSHLTEATAPLLLDGQRVSQLP